MLIMWATQQTVSDPEPVLGPELNGDSDFDTAVGWTGNGGAFTVTGGSAVGNDDVGNLFRVPEGGAQVGEKTYRTILTVIGSTFGGVRVRLTGTAASFGITRIAAGIYEEDIIATNLANLGLQAQAAVGSGDMEITSLSVKELISP